MEVSKNKPVTKKVLNGWIIATTVFILIEIALRLKYIMPSPIWNDLVNAWPYATGLMMLFTVLAAIKYYLENRNYPRTVLIGLIVALIGGVLVFMR